MRAVFCAQVRSRKKNSLEVCSARLNESSVDDLWKFFPFVTTSLLTTNQFFLETADWAKKVTPPSFKRYQGFLQNDSQM